MHCPLLPRSCSAFVGLPDLSSTFSGLCCFKMDPYPSGPTSTSGSVFQPMLKYANAFSEMEFLTRLKAASSASIHCHPTPDLMSLHNGSLSLHRSLMKRALYSTEHKKLLRSFTFSGALASHRALHLSTVGPMPFSLKFMPKIPHRSGIFIVELALGLIQRQATLF